MPSFEVKEIAYIRSPFREKFGIPRQSSLCSIESKIVFKNSDDLRQRMTGIESSTHFWVISWLEVGMDRTQKTKVRAPRFFGKKKIGVYACRTPDRPYPIGLSLGKLISVEEASSEFILKMTGLDLLNGTPVIDLKPYLPYCDRVFEADSDFLKPELYFDVQWNSEVKKIIENYNDKIVDWVEEIIAYDPRPFSQKNKDEFHLLFENWDFHWRVDGKVARIEKVDWLPVIEQSNRL